MTMDIGLEVLQKQINEARSQDDLFDLKCSVHDELMNHYFGDRVPMLMMDDPDQRDECADLMNKIGACMTKIFGE